MEISIPKKFKPLFEGAYDKYRVIVYYGGRGAGKSVTLSYFAILKCLQDRIRFYIVRKVEKSKANSIHSLIKRLLRESNLFDYVKSTSIDKITFINGSELLFDGVSERTIDNIRSADNIRYFWFEEAHGLKDDLMQVLIPSVRADNSQVIVSLNPQKSTDYIYTQYIKSENIDNSYSIAIKVNYNDNPFLPEVLDRDRLRDLKMLPREVYLHIWEGETNDYNDLKVINTELIGYFDNNKTFDYRYLVLSIDTATSVKSGADYSAIGVFGLLDSKEVHLVHMNRGHYDFHTLLSEIKNTYEITKELTKRTPNLILLESKANGLSVMQELQRTTNLRVKGFNPMSDKLSRVVNDFLPFIDKLKLPMQQNIYNFWINDYLSECKGFRADNKHEHDDMIDSTSQALAFLCRKTFNYENIKEAFSGLKN
jgi:PBSX family phage terminase large subunit